MSAKNKVAKAFKKLKQNCGDSTSDNHIEVTTEEDHLDTWIVTFFYPKKHPDAYIKLKFFFSLTEFLPPTVKVLGPQEVNLICYKELGTIDWKPDCDIVNLIMNLMITLGEKYTLDGAKKTDANISPEVGQSIWTQVKNGHPDWGMVDNEEKNKAMGAEALNLARKGAKEELENLK